MHAIRAADPDPNIVLPFGSTFDKFQDFSYAIIIVPDPDQTFCLPFPDDNTIVEQKKLFLLLIRESAKQNKK